MTDPQAQAARTHERIAQSASDLEHSATQQVSAAERNTQLAIDRTVLAAERT